MLHLSKNLVIESLFEPMVLLVHATPRNTRRHRRIVEDRGEIQASRLPVIDRRLHVETVDAPDHFVNSAEAQPRHVFADLLGKEEKEIDDVLRLPLKLLAQFWILSCDSHRTSIKVALAHHDAAHRDQWSSSKAEFLRPK